MKAPFGKAPATAHSHNRRNTSSFGISECPNSGFDPRLSAGTQNPLAGQTSPLHLRFSVPPGPRRANLSAVYALFGVALIPVSILAIRLSQRFIHPVAFDRGGPNMAASQFFTFCVSWAALLVLAATLYHVELAGKRIDVRLRELREALR